MNIDEYIEMDFKTWLRILHPQILLQYPMGRVIISDRHAYWINPTVEEYWQKWIEDRPEWDNVKRNVKGEY